MDKQNPFKIVVAISSKHLPAQNISWKTTLDGGKWEMLQSTTQMIYDPVCVEFFVIVYLLFGASAINVLHGLSHFSHIVTEQSRKGHCDPTEVECSFAVPSIKTLPNIDFGYPSTIPCGFIELSLDVAEVKKETGKQYVLMFDRKLASQGCKGEDIGDRLVGKGTPSLPKAKKLLWNSLKCIDKIEKSVNLGNVGFHILNVKQVISYIS